MEVKIARHPDKSQVELTITATRQDFSPYIEKAVKKLSADKPIKGFRPGKVTVPVALESYGKERVLHEALDLAMPQFFVQAVLEHDVEAIARPSITITTLDLETGLAFTAAVDVIPEVTLGDVSAITITQRATTITDEEVDKELALLAKMRATPLDVARPAQTGDTVTVDFKVSANGQLLEGGESKNHPIHIGEGYFVPDFEEKLMGINAGDEREFTIHFPADYAKVELRDTTANVWVKAHAVQKRVLPELNDDFAKKLGKFPDLKALKDTLRQNILHEKEHKERDRFRAELSEKLAAVTTFGPLPSILVEREIDSRLQEFSQMLSLQQKTIDDYLAQHTKTLAQVREEMRPASEKAVKIALALRALATKEKIEVDEKEINEKTIAYLQQYASPDAARQQADPTEIRDNVTSMLRNQKTLKRLEELVKVSTETPTPVPTAQ